MWTCVDVKRICAFHRRPVGLEHEFGRRASLPNIREVPGVSGRKVWVREMFSVHDRTSGLATTWNHLRDERTSVNVTHHGFHITTRREAGSTSRNMSAQCAIDLEPIWLWVIVPIRTNATGYTSSLQPNPLRDRVSRELESRVSAFHQADFVGWRLQNLRHILAAPPRTNHYLERRSRGYHVRHSHCTAPLSRGGESREADFDVHQFPWWECERGTGHL